jgi:hypothetical protein
MSSGSRTLLIVLITLLCSPAFAQVDRLPGFPPATWDVRREYSESARGSLGILERVGPTVLLSRVSGSRVRVSTDANTSYRYLIFVPEQNGRFEIDQPGTYVLRRRADGGALDQLKVFLRGNEDFFIRLFPSGENRSQMSVFLAGTEIHRRLPVPVGLLQALEMPLTELLSLVEQRVEWYRFYPSLNPQAYQTVRLVADRARAMLHTLPDAEDGAMDASGRLVSIESLVLQEGQPGFNCSGFAKWIADGLAIATQGRYLPIEPLKTKHLEYRGTGQSRTFEDDRDPYFGLDWTRNLALELRGIPAASAGDPEIADVRTVPYATYVEDAGFPVSQLEQILYLESVANPGNIYFASLNRQFGNAPVLHQHVHVAVLFPYFDDSGEFHLVVMERNVETSADSLVRRYGDGYVHLVRIPVSEQFSPPVILH